MKKFNLNRMSHYLTTAIVVSFLAFNSQSALAYSQSVEECNKEELSDIAYSRCLDGIKERADRELQTWINNQVFILEEVAIKTGRYSALNMFKRSQSDFIKFRENNCRWQYLALSPDPRASTAFKQCYIRATNTRINELSFINKESK